MSGEGHDREGQLRLDFDGNWTLEELSSFLASLRIAYGRVLAFQHIVDILEDVVAFYPAKQ